MLRIWNKVTLLNINTNIIVESIQWERMYLEPDELDMISIINTETWFVYKVHETYKKLHIRVTFVCFLVLSNTQTCVNDDDYIDYDYSNSSSNIIIIK